MSLTDQESRSARRFVAARARTLDLVAAHETDALVDEQCAAGRDVISLYGSPHWLPPEHVRRAARSAIDDNGGAPLPDCRRCGRLWQNGSELRRESSPIPLRRSQSPTPPIMPCPSLFTTVLEPGAEILTFSPHYYYQGIITLAGGVPTYAATVQAEGWRWDIEALRAAVTPRTTAILVNTPTNPTGYTATREDLRLIVELAAERDLLIISDEAYDHTIYDGGEHISIASLPEPGSEHSRC